MKAQKRELVAVDLQAMRDLLGKTQVDVAKAAAMTQGEVSRLESRGDCLLSTLRRYVEALGGELKVIADFGEKQVRIRTTG